MTIDLRTDRLNRGWSQAEAARQMGVSPYAYRRLEAGKSAAPASVKQVADFYGLTVVEFLSGEREASAA